MFGLFNWLTGKGRPIPITSVTEPKVKGTFEYQVKVYCHGFHRTYFYTVTTHDDVTQPIINCPCGDKVRVFPAPIVTRRKIGNILHESRAGELLVISDGWGHRTHLGRTFVYEETAA